MPACLQRKTTMTSATPTISPMTPKYGVGFTTQSPLPEEQASGYRLEVVGRFHNYHVTPARWEWPEVYPVQHKGLIIDGFSPNMNKELHVGHLRNLAIARSLKSILRGSDTTFVALIGCSLGVKKAALDGWKRWTNFVHYHPHVYYDVALPQDVIESREPTVEEVEKRVIDVNEPGPDWALPKLWDGPNGPVIVIRADGRHLYAFHDLTFAKEVGPTHYITGHEQKGHFANLGLGDKHLSMGLVCGTDGKKLSSRNGTALLATDALEAIITQLGDMADRNTANQVAWNILVWNFLHASRGTDLKFEVEKWVRPEAPGMYASYTYARVKKALDPMGSAYFNEIGKRDGEITEDDAKLLGLSEQYLYYHNKAITAMDPAPIANFAHELARALGVVYEKERIRDGRPIFAHVVRHALWRLEHCLTDLGMFLVSEV